MSEKEYWKDYSEPHWKIVEAGLALGFGTLLAIGLRSPDFFSTWDGWVLTIGVAVTYGGLKLMQHDLDGRKQAKLNDLVGSVSDSQGKLTHLLNTMPPADALRTFSHSYMAGLISLRGIRGKLCEVDDENVAELEKLIKKLRDTVRVCLNGASRLYLQYEHKPLTTEVYGHWLQFYSMNDLNRDPTFKEYVRERLDYTDRDDDPFYMLEGVLHVDPEMTVAVKAGQDDASLRDENAEEVFLPIPKIDPENPGDAQERAIEIAPKAFLCGHRIFPSVRNQLTLEQMKLWKVGQQVVKKAEDYFHRDQKIGSAIAVRVTYDYDKTKSQGSGLPLGVTVIYTQDDYTKDGKGAILAYMNICRPIFEVQTEAIFDMVLLRDEIIQLRKSAESDSAQEDA
ncbi:hypothetical protein BE221DRAFT_148606 [Ostreococcus tauri]|uniref:Uncharacterized protein n=1 Tax=Ostreococcus tauri TaxID=70448 RepID=A0A1Y5I5D5_OSTTA|nr:hypothetical protein BE221DRAFT_148606 [Ostreococcus tauri]